MRVCQGRNVILCLTALWLVGRRCYGTWLFCYEGCWSSSQSPLGLIDTRSNISIHWWQRLPCRVIETTESFEWTKWTKSLQELIRSFLSSLELSHEHASGERNCRDSHRELWGHNSRLRCDSFMIREPTAYRELSLRSWFSFTYCAESGAVSLTHSLGAEDLIRIQ